MKRWFICSTVVLLELCAALAGDNWPQFRGPAGDGTSDSNGLPTTFGESDHVRWKVPIHGRAWSSPVVWANQIWITTASEDGRELYAVCVEKDSGKIVHDKKLFDVATPQFAHKFNSYGSPTPAIEEGRVYITFGSPGTACLDTKSGKVLWERRDFECNHFRGAGSSPIIHGNLLILNFDGSDFQFHVALNKNSGKTVWNKQRSLDYKDLDASGKPQGEGDFRKAFSTPHIATFDAKPVLLSQGAKAAYGLNPVNGEEYFRVEERTSHSAADRPLVFGDLVLFTTGFSKGQLLAIHPGRISTPLRVIDANDNSATNHASESDLYLAWKSKRNVPSKPSLQRVGELLFMVDDGGIASCLEAATGTEVWRERIGGNYSASPIAAEGHVYFLSEEGKVAVIEAGRTFKKINENQLGDGFMASPAVTGRALILRSRTHLYRVEN